MKAKLLQWSALIVVIEIGVLHLMLAQGEYDEAAYMGYLFVANFFGALLAALGIYRRQAWGWLLGLAIVAGSLAGYAWSRTLGMPEMNVEEWFTPYGIAAMALEALFIVLAALRPWKMADSEAALSVNLKSLLPVFGLLAILAVSSLPFQPFGLIAIVAEAVVVVLLLARPWKMAWLDRLPSLQLSYLLPLAGVLALAVMSVATYRWDVDVTTAYGYHVGTLEQVLDTKAATQSEMEEKYGVQVSLAANTMMNSIVDVRLRVVDPVKAHALMLNQAALLVDSQALILAPHMHSHTVNRLKVGRSFTIFFPTQQIVNQGTQVSLVFGSVRMPAVVVR